jgi:hypothetical protein
MNDFNNYDPDNPKKEQKSYSVRIPIIDPCFKLSRNSFNIQIYLYLKSKKPQEWWQMKGTSALIQMDV